VKVCDANERDRKGGLLLRGPKPDATDWAALFVSFPKMRGMEHVNKVGGFPPQPVGGCRR
jgi:hypothetical protein